MQYKYNSILVSLISRAALLLGIFLCFFSSIRLLRVLKPSFFHSSDINKIALLSVFIACVFSSGSIIYGDVERILNLASIALFVFLAKYYFHLPLNIMVPLAVAIGLNSIFQMFTLKDEAGADGPVQTSLNLEYTALFTRVVSNLLILFSVPALLNFLIFPGLNYPITLAFMLIALSAVFFITLLSFYVWSTILCSNDVIPHEGIFLHPILDPPLFGIVTRDAKSNEEKSSYEIKTTCCGF